MSKRSNLRLDALDRAGGRCEFDGCTYTHTKLAMAHLSASGMGGSEDRDDLDNVAIFCTHHHDWLDCRITPNMRRFENEQVTRSMLNRWWASA